MNKRLLGACAAMACAIGFTGAANAATETFNFSGDTSYGVFSATATLDVVGGVAVSGTGTITGTDLGTQTLDLITASTPGAEVASDGTFGYRSNGGDDFFGFDDIAPSDFLFALGPNAPAVGANVIFGVYDVGGGVYQSGVFGYSSNNTRFYEYNTPTTVTVSAAPEPSTWLLMVAGVGAIGLMLRRAKTTLGLRLKTALAA